MKNTIYIFLGFILFSSCGLNQMLSVQTKTLYDINILDETANIDGFKSLAIFSENFDNTVWSSPEKHCVTLSKENKEVYEGKTSLHVKWDKISGGCNWIGIGFGWNNWQPKDLNPIAHKTALSMMVKSAHGKFSNLPVAFAIEDYSGVQTYYGFNTQLASGEFNDSAWTRVYIPLSNFPFKAKDADLGKVKQLIIQLEADGDIYIDDIKLVEIKNGK